ncbi:MAG: hypothetical protein LBQ47_05430 [Endomicrobium sp.]|jgi:hypothetical protein|nr:hypothetical protein [Endomicrobium sp.]
MSLYEVKRVQIISILKVFPIVFLILGAVIGIFTFFLTPTDLAAGLGFGARLLSWLIFVFLYAAIMSLGAICVAFLYNIVSAKVIGSGLVISLEPKE